ncbi:MULTISPECIES: Asp23/Gls24 family envelope stress response protein [unclassified Pseudonocardia]|uniref:Asp23/Gls24 family envelope stress response protein n=1 Tax=unclassified Pseudonocardia TaxID=2619320 RepID=UPI0007619E9D|nr:MULTISPECIES: Asp23/Gls24 family envelope stress response protein [unclassified Pseudonocardia]
MNIHDGGHDHHEQMDEQMLACGRSADALLGQVAGGQGERRDEHQSGCVHCQAALAEYERLWSPVRDLAAEKISAPEGRFDRILQRVRGALSEPEHAVMPGPDGVLRISTRVIVVIARRSAQSVTGVRVALGRTISGAADEHVAVGVTGESTAVEITLAADYGHDLRVLGEQVRQAVIDRIHELTGLHAAEVTVSIDDVLE